MVNRYLLLLSFLSALAFFGCAGPDVEDAGKAYSSSSGSFRGRWWHYYERGREYSDRQLYGEAAADFAAAIKGRDLDQWRARTYGMHFIDYFPHRELGVVHFQRGQYDLAIAELKESIRSTPNAKAHFFLNRARAEKIRLDGTDTSAPELYLQNDGGKELSNGFTFDVRGRAADDTYVAAVRIGDIQMPLELAEKEYAFNTRVALREGENVIRVTAIDLADRKTVKELSIFCDRRGPLVEIMRVENRGGRKFISGIVSDETGLRSLTINGEPQQLPLKSLQYSFAVPAGGKLEILAVDEAGNSTRASAGEQELMSWLLPGPRLANVMNGAPSGAMTISDAPSLSAVVQALPRDTEAPFIALENLAEEQETFEEYVLLEGRVADLSPIHSLAINGEPVAGNNGRKLYFSRLEKLAEGDNHFSITAVDIHGNRSEKSIRIIRRIKNIRQIGSRMSVAVIPFEHRGEGSILGETVPDLLIDSLLEQKRFNVLERQKIAAVLRELNLSSTNLVNPDEAADLGRIVAANAMLTGTIIESPQSIEIIGRLIDTETATILASNDIYGEDKSFAAVGNLLDGLAFKFKRDFPLVEGILIEVRNDEALIDIGSDRHIKPNLQLICYREGPERKHPVTGRILHPEPEILGNLRVDEVYEDFSRASLRTGKAELKIYDRVIIR